MEGSLEAPAGEGPWQRRLLACEDITGKEEAGRQLPELGPNLDPQPPNRRKVADPRPGAPPTKAQVYSSPYP